MRRDNFDGQDYFKLAKDCVYYTWQNGWLTDEELTKTELNMERYEQIITNIKKRIAYYEERITHCSVFTTEYTICLAVIQILKELLNE